MIEYRSFTMFYFVSDDDKYHDGITINKSPDLQASPEELITIFKTTKLSQ